MHVIARPTEDNLERALDVLSEGGLVVFPTETVYGLGGNAYDDSVVAKIFQYKNRSEFSPLSVCYASLEAAGDDVVINARARLLAEKFLPGPVTVILKRRANSRLSWLCSSGLETIGVRIPSHDTLRYLLERLPFPLAAPSANRSAELSSTTALDVSRSLSANGELFILDGGRSQLGIESTILDLTSEKIKVLRMGAANLDEISAKCDFQLAMEDGSSSKPATHYRPKKKVVINASFVPETCGLLAFGEPFPNKCRRLMNLSRSENLQEAAANLFFMLRKLDETNIDAIYVMPIPQRDVGIVINDRLTRMT
ncbi:MAG: threonylcarbamoyl-AMP synthase [Holosporaceae bacterium]|jgi:L-threonylcarbamoyladenylate synthase|nr:threonylcarbamoyl-AMP synthase [Holosporaceae bacterium]